MKTFTHLSVIMLFCSASSAVDIIPKPEKVELGKGAFAIGAETVISIASSPEKLKEPAELLAGYLKAGKITSEKAATNAIVLEMSAKDSELGDEGYKLDVVASEIKITAGSIAGIRNGIQSLRQLYDSSAAIPCLRIIDRPRYSWRGLMLDESRHFFGKEQVLKLLDRMAYYKLNRFHWHLTDAPGWRIEIKKYPKLTSVGGKGNHSNKNAPLKFYTQKEIKEVVAYAGMREITVIPEIDMPGHASAANRAYPEYSGGGSKRLPNFTFNPGKEETYAYLTDILKETTDLFPGPWLHFGGDEAHFGNAQWKNLPEVKERMKKENYTTLLQIEHYFNRRMADVITSLGKTTIGWDEVTESGIRPDQSVVMWWRHNKEDALQKALEKGFGVILCPRIPCYFDFVQHSSHKSGRRMKSKFSDLPGVYAFPDGLIKKVDNKKQAQIMGIQACVWTERIKEVRRLEFMTFPRLAGLSEAAWTAKDGKDYKDFLERLKFHLKQYEKWGVCYFNPFEPKSVKEPIGP